MVKHEFYIILLDADSGGLAEEFPRSESDSNFDSRYFRFIGKMIPDWQTIHFAIREGSSVMGDAFDDYQFVLHGFRLCSQRMKDLFETHKSPDDKIQWLDATVTWNGETRPYYVLHFYEDTDVVDPVLSQWNPKTKTYDAIPRIYIREKIGDHNIFALPHDYLGLTVRAFILKEIKRQQMTGMTWEPAIVR